MASRSSASRSRSPSYNDETPAPSLNVTLLIDGIDEAVPDKADFLANRNQQGAGRAAEGLRPTNALSADQPIAQLGSPDGADLVDGTPRELVPSAEQLVSRAQSPDGVTAQPQPTDDPADTRRKAAALDRPARAADHGGRARFASRVAERR